MSLTCITGCVSRDRHLTDCPCADPNHEHAGRTEATYEGPLSGAPGWTCHWCSGCLPRLAAIGLAVCAGCETRSREALRDLPDLWVDLAERPRLAGVSKAPEGEGDTPEPLNSDQRSERSAIKALLVAWCLILEEDGIAHVPDERRIAETTRRLAAWHSDMARQCRDAAFIATQPKADGTLPDIAEYRRIKTDEHTHSRSATASRDDRETGRDIVRAIAEHVTRHLTTLLAGEHAEQLASDLRKTLRDARRRANPGRPIGIRLPCPDCGHRTRMELDAAGDITCPACGERGDAKWWARSAVEPPVAPALEEEIVSWMFASHRMDIKGDRIRQWAARGKIETTNRDDGRAGYDPFAVCEVAYQMQAKRAS